MDRYALVDRKDRLTQVKKECKTYYRIAPLELQGKLCDVFGIVQICVYNCFISNLTNQSRF